METSGTGGEVHLHPVAVVSQLDLQDAVVRLRLAVLVVGHGDEVGVEGQGERVILLPAFEDLIAQFHAGGLELRLAADARPLQPLVNGYGSSRPGQRWTLDPAAGPVQMWAQHRDSRQVRATSFIRPEYAFHINEPQDKKQRRDSLQAPYTRRPTGLTVAISANEILNSPGDGVAHE